MTRSSRVWRLCLVLALFALGGSLRADERPRSGASFKLPPNFAAKAAAYMEARVRVSGFGGAVLVAHAGRSLFRRAYGMANLDFDIPNTPRTKFRLGSVTKQFTAAAILRLQERGRLNVTDTIGQHLPDWPAAWADVTIHHLLTHTGGLPRLTPQTQADVGGLSRPTAPPRFRSLRELYKPGEELQPLDFRPGAKFAYSNIGYIVLGIIIEKVSGKPYAEFMREEVFGPLGMTDTGCEEPGQILKQRASGYTRIDGKLVGASYVDVRFPSAAGALYSTVDDLLLWDRGLATNRLLSAASRDRLLTPLLANYAYGWWVPPAQFNRKVQWHRGNIAGFVAIVARYPDEELFVAVLSNIERTPVRAVANELAAIALGEPYELPYERKESKIDPAAVGAYLGEYHKVGQPNDTFIFARDGDRLLVQVPEASPFEGVPESLVQFFSRSIEFQLTFVRDDKGGIKHVLVRRDGEESRWVRSP
jgi:CubicO group peptidase (beta-lactamase class C family)